MAARYVGVPRRCERCKADLHMSAEAQPHLCKDIAKRLARQEKQIAAVEAVLEGLLSDLMGVRTAAEAIVRRLNNMGINDD